jgi:hypothetical protein
MSNPERESMFGKHVDLVHVNCFKRKKQRQIFAAETGCNKIEKL